MPNFDIEQSLCTPYVFGFDEAGRGPWCGPVVAACVCFPDFKIDPTLAAQINDSKKLTDKKRRVLFPMIQQSGALIGIGQASAAEIDTLNILRATFLAMRRAKEDIERQGFSVPFALIDGNRLPKDWDIPAQCMVKGDALSLSIAAASIIAKVSRDNIMQTLAQTYPAYDWENNAGYGTAKHIQALQTYGITPEHRKSYAPIAALLKHA